MKVVYLKNKFIWKDSKEIVKFDILKGVIKTQCFHIFL